jgi:hypothetical protein
MQHTEHTNRRECYEWGGWYLADDDVPQRPELSPLNSAQARRAWKQSTPTRSAQPKLN